MEELHHKIIRKTWRGESSHAEETTLLSDCTYNQAHAELAEIARVTLATLFSTKRDVVLDLNTNGMDRLKVVITSVNGQPIAVHEYTVVGPTRKT